MWYFAWMLGVTMAVLLAIVNAMWCEAKECALREREALRNTAPGNTHAETDTRV